MIEWKNNKNTKYCKQETRLSLINHAMLFWGQSRSPNMVPFHMLGMPIEVIESGNIW